MNRPPLLRLGSATLDLEHACYARGGIAGGEAARLALNGRRVAAIGTGAAGLLSVVLAGREVARDGPAPAGAGPRDAVLTPLGWERRLELDGRRVVERMVADREAPVLFCEWEALDAMDLWIRWSAPLAAPTSVFLFSREPDARTGATWEAAGPQPDRSRMPAPGTGPEMGPEARTLFRLEPGERLRLAVSADDDPARAGSLADAAGEPAIRVMARAAALGRADAERVLVGSPVEAVEIALGWAAAVLDACAPRPDTAVWAGLAALGLGRFEAGAAMIGDSELARVAVSAWTGRRAVGAADAAASPGDPLHLTAGQVRGAPGGSAWAAYEAGDPDRALDRWLADVASGPLPGRLPDSVVDASWAAAVTLPFIYGLLGAAPDATLQRLRLRPRIPAAWDRLDVERMRIGDGGVALRYRRDGDRHAFTIEQETGAVPLTLLFEPAIAGTRLRAALVDGRTAELDVLAAGNRLVMPVQLVLDHERRVELDVG